MKRVLIFYGGWEGHDPNQFADQLKQDLSEQRYEVTCVNTLNVLDDPEALKQFDVIIPLWTMGELSEQREKNLVNAVASGVGLAGWHGGMADAFRDALEYKMMVGGQFVSHPGNVRDYTVNIVKPDDPIVKGIRDFAFNSEQYYMHVDPSNDVLATTTFSGSPLPWLEGVEIPVVWKRMWGQGRVFYCSLGHQVHELEVEAFRVILRRGIDWASRNDLN